jgi:transcriptional regulator with XRE-family HTH domain
MTTLANYFKEIRESKNLTMEDIGKRAGLDRSTIWKIENGRPIRPGTMRTIAKRGLRLKESSQEYATLVSLWIVHRGLSDEPELEIAKAFTRISKESNRRLQTDSIKIAKILQTMLVSDQKALVRAMGNPESLAAIIALAHHFTK